MSDLNNKLQIESNIVKGLKEIFDPEIPVNIYELGLIYEVNVKENFDVDVIMTLTAPNCPVADTLPEEVREKVQEVEGVKNAHVELVFDPPWDQDMMSEEAKLELGLF